MAKLGKEGKLYATTGFRNSGRRAGNGILSDDYSEASGNKDYEKYGRVRFPHDKLSPESLNGPVIIVQEGKKKQ